MYRPVPVSIEIISMWTLKRNKKIVKELYLPASFPVQALGLIHIMCDVGDQNNTTIPE